MNQTEAIEVLRAAIRGIHAIIGPTETGEAALAATANLALTSEPVGEVMEVSEHDYLIHWAENVPAAGTKLYTRTAPSAPTDAQVANAVRGFINAGKRGLDMFGAMKSALEESRLAE